MSEWKPDLASQKVVSDFLDTMLQQLLYLLGIDEIISSCEVILTDPYAVGTLPRYIRVRIHEYYQDVLFRGGLDINVGDYVHVIHMREGDRYEVLAIGGASGEVTLTLESLAGYARGYIIRGGATDWEAYDAAGDGYALVGDGTDINSEQNPTWSGQHTWTTGPQEMQTGALGNKGLIIKAAAGQTANLQEWQNSGATALACVDENGYIGSGVSAPTQRLALEGAGHEIAYIKSTHAGNSATYMAYNNVDDYVQLKIYGTAFGLAALQGNAAYVSKNTTFFMADGSVQNGGTSKLHYMTGGWDTSTQIRMTIDSTGYVGINQQTPGAMLQIDTSAAGTIGLIVKGAAAQTANLQEWQDSAGGELVSIQPAGLLQIGGANADFTAGAQVRVSTSSAPVYVNLISHSNTASHGPGIWIKRSRGTAPGSKSALQDDDRLFFITGSGWEGAAYQNSVAILGEVDGAVAGGSLPARLVFQTGTTSSRSERMRIFATGEIQIGGANTDFESYAQWRLGSPSTGALYMQAINYSNTASHASGLLLWRSRGTAYGSKSAVQDDDRLFFLTGGGWSGTNFRNSVGIVGYVDGAVSGVSVPGRLSFETGTSSRTERLRIHYDGAIIVPNATTTVVPFTIMAAASQTANLQEWQNSAGTVLTYIEADGEIVIDQDSKAIKFGADQDMDIGYDGTDGYIRTDLQNASDLNVDCGANKTIELQTTVWDDFAVPTTAIRLVGASPADEVPYKGGYVLSFDDAVDEYIYFTIQLPHKYKEGTDVKFHIHWTIKTSGVGGGAENVKWDMTYSASSPATPAESWPAESTGTATIDVQSDSADDHLIDTVATLTGTNFKISEVIICSLKRDTAVANNYGDEAYVVSADVHYEIDTVGSRQELAK